MSKFLDNIGPKGLRRLIFDAIFLIFFITFLGWFFFGCFIPLFTPPAPAIPSFIGIMFGFILIATIAIPVFISWFKKERDFIYQNLPTLPKLNPNLPKKSDIDSQSHVISYPANNQDHNSKSSHKTVD